MKRIVLSCLVGICVFCGHAGLRADAVPVPDLVNQLSDHFENLARKVGPAVVSIEAVKSARGSDNGKRPVEESGSGVLVKITGHTGYLVITNNHVITQARPEQITIHLADGRLFRPSRVLTDPETDIALLVLDRGTNLPTALLGNSDTARVGRMVLAIGSPFGLSQTVTKGIISARDRGQVSLGSTIRIKDFLQTDAAINPGSSGGPLIDMRGEVIGINTAIASHNGSNSGVAFSIPINLVKRVMVQMLREGTVSRGYLGMQLAQTFEPAEAMKLGMDRLTGALVERIYPETPAASAGLKVNDVILQIESVAVRNENHLINLISTLPVGQRVRLQVWRDRSVVALEAVVGDWGKAQSRFREP
ncbi:MAG: PDZ domain-containing protein [Planctomycetes bacterium]|nr:PDZ domain-containing protein [Planctomycetota bacterium]